MPVSRIKCCIWKTVNDTVIMSLCLCVTVMCAVYENVDNFYLGFTTFIVSILVLFTDFVFDVRVHVL